MTQNNPASKPTPGQDYTVQAGDSLSKIALEAYGDGSEAFWRLIYNANRELIGDNPNLIQPGMVLHIGV